MNEPNDSPADDAPAESAPAEADPVEAAGPTLPELVEAPAVTAAMVEKPHRTEPEPKPGRLLLILGVPLLALLVLYLRPRTVDLAVDNAIQAPVLVSVNGEELGRVERLSALTFEGLPAGPVELHAVQLGPEGELGQEYTISADLSAGFFAARPTWVWNVGSEAPHYVIVTQGYGDQLSQVYPPERFDPPGEVFLVPDGVLPGVNAAMPAQVKVTGGETGTTRRVLWSNSFFADVKSRLEHSEGAVGASLNDMMNPPQLHDEAADPVPPGHSEDDGHDH